MRPVFLEHGPPAQRVARSRYGMSTARLFTVLLGGLAVGGLGAIYVWSARTALLKGDLNWQRGVSAAVVAAALILLLGGEARYVRHLEQLRLQREIAGWGRLSKVKKDQSPAEPEEVVHPT